MEDQIKRLEGLEKSYDFVEGLEETTRKALSVHWKHNQTHWELLTWCVTRKHAIELEGDKLVDEINSRIFLTLEDEICAKLKQKITDLRSCIKQNRAAASESKHDQGINSLWEELIELQDSLNFAMEELSGHICS